PTNVGAASVVMLDPRWAKLVGKMVFNKRPPPQDLLMVANATGVAGWDRMVAGALRGGGWNVRTSIEQPVNQQSELVGTSQAAKELARIFTSLRRRNGNETVLRIGADLAPIQG
ncbi:MAG: LytR C-terminal domain-containing protein, partial [Candidatus Eremiobacteraeota bacterium]|nr:LytR C-terminal domain-containing protein [Candidatus Eremiobacteraeota bacterium]